ncbi:MAG: Na/Pi cotransporter family protein [Ruminococcus sp.]|nr:Na/Pi cotransporter family protein [Ruminococcus sp.]
MDILGFIGGLSFFLFGINVMETGLKNLSGDKISDVLLKVSDSSVKGIVLGAGITAFLQSSSAVTVSLIGIVEAGILDFSKSTSIIMGANIGTSVTAWIISTSGIESDRFLIHILNPSTLSPVIGLVGVFFIILSKKIRNQNTGYIMIGFSLLMSGISSMSLAMENITDLNAYTKLMTLFQNPFFGIIFGIVLTAVIQSSSASIGILQSISISSGISCSSAIPIILGQNIGTCITAVIACVGSSKEAKKICVFHILFNVIGSAVWMIGYFIAKLFLNLDMNISSVTISILHTLFNLSSVMILLPFKRRLENITNTLIGYANSF